MGKSACFAQQRAIFWGADGQKYLFCPTKGCFFGRGWAKMPVLPNEWPFFGLPMGKSAGFAQQRAVFPSVDGQKCLYCPMKGCFFGRGWAKMSVLPNEGLVFRARAGLGDQG